MSAQDKGDQRSIAPLRLDISPPMGSMTTPSADLLPVRMLNECVYCERLMYLEWVQREFADNAFTAHGHHVHRRPDRTRGALKAACGRRQPEDPEDESIDDDPLPYVAESVSLSSDELGITSVIDIVEVGESGKEHVARLTLAHTGRYRHCGGWRKRQRRAHRAQAREAA